MPAVVALCLALWSCVCWAQTWPVWPQFQFANANLGWVVDRENVIGHRTRVQLYNGQDPFPFCAAYAASILYDQNECMLNRADCSTVPRTSALSLVAASQSSERAVKFETGGSSLLALNYIVHNSTKTSHAWCNTDDVHQPRINKGSDLNNLFSHMINYHQFIRYRGYMMRYYRDEFLRIARTLGVTDTSIALAALRAKPSTVNELATELLLKNCDRRDQIRNAKYKVVFNSIKNFDIEASHALITQQLGEHRPVQINMCMNAVVGFQNCFKHATVVYAESTATNQITGDVRKVYQLANTWGESWQAAHSDGWIFADNMLEGVYEIMWLERLP